MREGIRGTRIGRGIVNACCAANTPGGGGGGGGQVA